MSSKNGQEVADVMFPVLIEFVRLLDSSTFQRTTRNGKVLVDFSNLKAFYPFLGAHPNGCDLTKQERLEGMKVLRGRGDLDFDNGRGPFRRLYLSPELLDNQSNSGSVSGNGAQADTKEEASCPEDLVKQAQADEMIRHMVIFVQSEQIEQKDNEELGSCAVFGSPKFLEYLASLGIYGDLDDVSGKKGLVSRIWDFLETNEMIFFGSEEGENGDAKLALPARYLETHQDMDVEDPSEANASEPSEDEFADLDSYTDSLIRFIIKFTEELRGLETKTKNGGAFRSIGTRRRVISFLSNQSDFALPAVLDEGNLLDESLRDLVSKGYLYIEPYASGGTPVYLSESLVPEIAKEGSGVPDKSASTPSRNEPPEVAPTNGVERTPAQRERFARVIRGLEEDDEPIAPPVEELEVSSTELPPEVASDDSHESDDGPIVGATEEVPKEEWSTFLGELDERADSSFSEPRYDGEIGNLIDGLSEIFSDLSGKKLAEVRDTKLCLTNKSAVYLAEIGRMEKELEKTRRLLGATKRRIIATDFVIARCEKMM